MSRMEKIMLEMRPTRDALARIDDPGIEDSASWKL